MALYLSRDRTVSTFGKMKNMDKKKAQAVAKLWEETLGYAGNMKASDLTEADAVLRGASKEFLAALPAKEVKGAIGVSFAIRPSS